VLLRRNELTDPLEPIKQFGAPGKIEEKADPNDQA
jgi:hypothetical protein